MGDEELKKNIIEIVRVRNYEATKRFTRESARLRS